MFNRFSVLTTLVLFTCLVFSAIASAESSTVETRYWMKVQAKDKFERTMIGNVGASIETTMDGYVIAIGNAEHLAAYRKMGRLQASYVLTDPRDFPAKDSNFHNYDELRTDLRALAARFPHIARFDSIGRSVEGRDLFRLRISGQLENADQLPAVAFMGGHHAREHVSIEMPLLLAKHLLENYANDPTIRRLVDSRDIHIIPMVNPDGAEFDVADGSYAFWRKNRNQANGPSTVGVDLNRNYGFQWGTGGSSTSPSSDVYMGPTPFSEPETQAIKSFVDRQSNITVLLSFHTYSELILYPWGHTYSSIPNAQDLAVFEKMAKTMSAWNGYTPQQASDLYIASGDTTDWAYGTHKIFAFTFELDPKGGFGNGGFYPGQATIPVVFRKNLQPCLYMLEYADNPYRVTNPSYDYGLTSLLVR